MSATKLFRECLSEVPNDVKIQVDLSFEIADRLYALLKECGMTQKEFAKRIGKSESEVSRWMSGTHNFTLSTIAKISDVLGYNIIEVKK